MRLGLFAASPISTPKWGYPTSFALSMSRKNEVHVFVRDFRALLVDDADSLAKGSGSKLEAPRGSRGKGACVIKSRKPNTAARRPIKDKHKRSSPYVLLRASDGPRRLFYLYKHHGLQIPWEGPTKYTPSHGLGARLRWAFPLGTVRSHASARQQTSPQFVVKSVCKPRMPTGLARCNGFSSLPVEEKALSWRLRWAFSPCLSRKRDLRDKITQAE